MRSTINALVAVWLICLTFGSHAQVSSVKAIALFDGRAMLSVDGGKPKIVHAGKTYKGVLLVSSTTKEAVVSVNGATERLTLNGTTRLTHQLGAKPSQDFASALTLYVNNRGFFESDGEINNQPVRFLIDTGANIVVLSSAHADRIGLDYTDGARSYASTASGVAPMYNVEIDEISIGGIELYNIAGGVIVGSYPEMPLLGMTFLSRLNMDRRGNRMILTRR